MFPTQHPSAWILSSDRYTDHLSKMLSYFHPVLRWSYTSRVCVVSGNFILKDDNTGVLPRRMAARKINEVANVKLLEMSTV